MKTLFLAICTLALLCGGMLAQTTSAPQTSAPQPPQASPNGEPQSTATAPATNNRAAGSQTPTNALKIAPGSVIPVQLTKTVDAKKAKTGDEVVGMVTMDMKTNSGDVLVPKDTKILGHVTEAQARNKDQKESQLGISFDHAVVKGNEATLPMSIQAIIAPQTNNNDNQAASGGGTPEAPSSGGSNSGMAGGHSPAGVGGSNQSAQQNYPQGGGSAESAPQTGARPPITGNTQGVIGMDNVKLESNAQNATQGSVVTSDKNNVKIEKGTLLLLRVSQ